MVWYPAWLFFLPMRYAMRTISTSPARDAPTMMGISIWSWFIWHSSARRSREMCGFVPVSRQCHQRGDERKPLYLQRTGWWWCRRVGFAAWTCWGRTLASRPESAPCCTCRSGRACCAGSSDWRCLLKTQLWMETGSVRGCKRKPAETSLLLATYLPYQTNSLAKTGRSGGTCCLWSSWNGSKKLSKYAS